MRYEDITKKNIKLLFSCGGSNELSGVDNQNSQGYKNARITKKVLADLGYKPYFESIYCKALAYTVEPYVPGIFRLIIRYTGGVKEDQFNVSEKGKKFSKLILFEPLALFQK